MYKNYNTYSVLKFIADLPFKNLFTNLQMYFITIIIPTTNFIFLQGSKGIRQWPINWCTSPIMIQKIIPYVD